MSSSIHEFVIRGGQTVTTGQMNAFRRKLPFLKVKATTFAMDEYAHLAEQTLFLTRYAEEVLDNLYPSEDISTIMETVFALGYLLKDVDIIPDDIPHTGLLDDAAVLRAVLIEHEAEFKDFAEKSGFDFGALALHAN